jgi:hypothetical protein
MSMLDIKDIVALDSAGALTIGGLLQQVQNRTPPIELSVDLNRSAGSWLLEHGYSLRRCLSSETTDEARDLTSIMEQYSEQLHDVHLHLPNNRIKTLTLMPRCSTLQISSSLTFDQIEELCSSASNVTELFFHGAAANAHPEHVSLLLLTVPKLQKLSCRCECLSIALPELKVMRTKLEQLSLSRCNADTFAQLFVEVSVLCPNLKHLRVADTRVNNADVAAVLEPFADNCRSLNTIGMHGFRMTTTTLRRVLSKCRSLRSIVRTSAWSAEDVLTVAECGARLDFIPVSHALLGELKTYAALFAQLQRVELGHDFLVSPSAVSAVSCMRILETLRFQCATTTVPGAVHISGVLQAVAVTCTQLRELSCNGGYITDLNFASALAAVLTNSTYFTYLYLGNDYEHTLIGTPMPQVLADALAQCRTLQRLEIECYDVTDSHMLPAIASLCWLDIVDRRLPVCTGAALP